jgi:hypothetical protein
MKYLKDEFKRNLTYARNEAPIKLSAKTTQLISNKILYQKISFSMFCKSIARK